MSEELKPCPFCGSEARAYKWGATFEVEIRCGGGCNISTSGIVVKRPLETKSHAYKRAYDIAKDKWNRRADKK